LRYVLVVNGFVKKITAHTSTSKITA
jgi:hypothetical protein